MLTNAVSSSDKDLQTLVSSAIGCTIPLAPDASVKTLCHISMLAAARHLSFPLAQGSMLGLGPP